MAIRDRNRGGPTEHKLENKSKSTISKLIDLLQILLARSLVRMITTARMRRLGGIERSTGTMRKGDSFSHPIRKLRAANG